MRMLLEFLDKEWDNHDSCCDCPDPSWDCPECWDPDGEDNTTDDDVEFHKTDLTDRESLADGHSAFDEVVHSQDHIGVKKDVV